MESSQRGDFQRAYQIILSTSINELKKNRGVWNSGKIVSGESSNIQYGGKRLAPNTRYFWKVRIWNRNCHKSGYSDIQSFQTGPLTKKYATSKYQVTLHYIKPRNIFRKSGDHFFIDFGKDAFGTLQIDFSKNKGSLPVELSLGEKLIDSATIDSKPPATIRYYNTVIPPNDQRDLFLLKLPAFKPPAWTGESHSHMPVPNEIADIMPFRYCELRNYHGRLTPEDISQVAIFYPFDNSTSSFESSSGILNHIWDLCKYSIKATTYCGIYVDGDRERRPYEADAYINQLGHYCVDREYALGRYSYEYFFSKPTWPTEWKFHSIFMAWQDYMYTGNDRSISFYYEQLKADKLLFNPTNSDGLLIDQRSRENSDIVDWPESERDNYELGTVNLVPNAFYYKALQIMSKTAGVLNYEADSVQFMEMALQLKKTIERLFINAETGLFVDSLRSKHSSLHANLFPLAFGLVPGNIKARVLELIKSKRMACSVYAAQYLLEALYLEGEEDYALELLTSTEKRSWWNMLRSGSTITLEAWDNIYKSNLDWNHAWGAVPANIIPRCLWGIKPLEPGFSKIQIKPQTGDLTFCSVKVPTIKGSVYATLNTDLRRNYKIEVNIPANTAAVVTVPIFRLRNPRVFFNGVQQPVSSTARHHSLELASGYSVIEIRSFGTET